MAKANLLGIRIDDPTLEQIFDYVDKSIKTQTVSYITTVNSELLQMSLTNPAFKLALEQSALRICDGVGVQWAATFSARHYPLIINLCRAPLSLMRLLIQPRSAARIIKNRTTGRLLFEALLAHAKARNYSVFILGGGEGVAQKVAQKARHQYPGLAITGEYAGRPEDAQDVIRNIKPSNILFIAYGSPKQEIFIHDYLAQLKTNLVIGVGGTFDAYVGAKPIGSAFRQIRPPYWVYQRGVESFWRLATQPNRLIRVLNSTIGFVFKVVVSARRRQSP